MEKQYFHSVLAFNKYSTYSTFKFVLFIHIYVNFIVNFGIVLIQYNRKSIQCFSPVRKDRDDLFTTHFVQNSRKLVFDHYYNHFKRTCVCTVACCMRPSEENTMLEWTDFLRVIHHVLGPYRDTATKDALSPFIPPPFPHSCVQTGVDLCF